MNRLLVVFVTAALLNTSVMAADRATLDLGTAQRRAIEDSPSLMAVRTRIDQARARVWQAASAYLPRVDATVSASKTWLPDNSSSSFGQIPIPDNLFGGSISGPNTIKNYRAGITATWTLFDGLSRWFQTAQARFGAKETELAYREAQRLLLDGVARAYYTAQLAREQITIAQADERFNRRQLEDAKSRRNVGAGSLSDELNFEVRANAAHSALIHARQGYSVAMIGLASLMGVPESTFAETTELEPMAPESAADMETPDTDALIEYAMSHRPDIKQGQIAVKRTQSGVGVERGSFFPQIAASASYQGDSRDDSNFENDEFTTVVGISLSYNLFAGGLDAARYAEARFAAREAKRQLQAIKIQATSEVRQAVESLKSARDDLRLQRQNAELVRRNRDLVEKEYAAGQSSLVRLNEAQKDLSQARAELAQARVTLLQAWHTLRTATAQTLENNLASTKR